MIIEIVMDLNRMFTQEEMDKKIIVAKLIKIRKDENLANNLISLDVKNCVLSFYAAFAF